MGLSVLPHCCSHNNMASAAPRALYATARAVVRPTCLHKPCNNLASSRSSSLCQPTQAVTAAKKDKGKGKAPNKADLPSKICVTCGRPFTWRKKWARVWDEVKYCSDRCRGSKPSQQASQRQEDEVCSHRRQPLRHRRPARASSQPFNFGKKSLQLMCIHQALSQCTVCMAHHPIRWIAPARERLLSWRQQRCSTHPFSIGRTPLPLQTQHPDLHSALHRTRQPPAACTGSYL